MEKFSWREALEILGNFLLGLFLATVFGIAGALLIAFILNPIFEIAGWNDSPDLNEEEYHAPGEMFPYY